MKRSFSGDARTLDELRAQAASCTSCDLYKCGTQVVFGEGSVDALLMLVGEQPGNEEDLAGQPFVGPAGKLLNTALADAGIARREIYITNAVKHFKWQLRGKRRIHQKPSLMEINACSQWLDAEFQLVRRALIVCLGATAVQAVFQRPMPIGKNRGKLLHTSAGRAAVITTHPSAILRAPTSAARAVSFKQLVDDLKIAKAAAQNDR